MPTSNSLPIPNTPINDPRTGLVSREWTRFFYSLNRNTSDAVAGEVLTPAGGGLDGGGLVADGLSLSIEANGVTSAMLRQSAGFSVIGRPFSSTGDVSDIVATADNRVLARIGGLLAFFPLSSIPAVVADGDYGDITVSGTGTVWTIDNTAVTFAKIQNITTARLLGRTTAGSGSVEQLTVSSPLSLAAGALSITSAALTRVDDTNVTLTLGGAPSTALLAATSLTLGWAGTLSVARGGTGDSGTAWASFSPTITASTGTYTTTTATGFFKQLGKTVFVRITIAVGDQGTAANNTLSTLPVAAKAATDQYIGGYEAATGKSLRGAIQSSDVTKLLIAFYDNTFSGTTGNAMVVGGTYEAA